MGDGNPGRTLPRVVVLDDNRSALTLAEGMLKARGMLVTPILVDGSQSLEQIANQIVSGNPKLVLSDLEMGIFNGIQLRDAVAAANNAFAFVIHSTEPEKVPNANQIAASNDFGDALKSAYQKGKPDYFNDIAKFLKATPPERSL